MGYRDSEFDYDWEREPSEEEIEEYEENEGEENTNATVDCEELKISFNVRNFARGIANEAREGLKAYIISDLKQSFMRELKEDIMSHIKEISMQIVKEVYETETVSEGWGNDKKEYTVHEYIMSKVKESFHDGKFTFKEKDRWGDVKTKEVSLVSYIDSKIDYSEVQERIDKEINVIRKDINRKIKDIFDSSTKQMLSDNVLQVLMANETYRKIQSNVACIADKNN